MKKFLFLLLSAAIAVSASAGFTKSQVQTTFKNHNSFTKGKVEQMVRHANGPVVSTPFTGKIERTREAIPEGYAQVMLVAGDVWGDGSGYQLLMDADATAYGDIIPTTGPLARADVAASVYAQFEYKIPENADGALDTENFLVNNSASIFVPAGTYDWCITNPTPGSNGAMWIVGTNGRYDDYVIEAGKIYRFTISMGSDNHDQAVIDILEPGGGLLTIPTNVTVVPATTTADVAWDDDDDVMWNLRYRPTPVYDIECDLNMEDAEAQLSAGWGTYDADEDGNDWELYYTTDAEDDLCWMSFSYDFDNQADLDPDNWLVSPDFTLKAGTVVKWDAEGYSDYWADSYMVYVMIYQGEDEDPLFFSLAEEDFKAGTGVISYSLPIGEALSDYVGSTACVIWRHYNSAGNAYMILDNIFIGEEPAWIYEYGLEETEFPMEGLTPETEYEVQVQATYNGGASDWTDSYIFTTLADLSTVYILGEVNDQEWGANAGTPMDFDEQTGLYTLTVTCDGRNSGYNYFGFTNKLGADTDDWDAIGSYRFGAVSDGDFWINEDMYGNELSLTRKDGQAFRIAAGEYKFTVDMENMKLIVEKIEPQPQGLRGDANDDGDVTIADVTTLIDYLLGTTPEPWNEDNANVNLDDTISIADVTVLIDFLLSGSWPE